MRRRLLPQAIPGSDICVFCKTRLRTVPPSRAVVSLLTPCRNFRLSSLAAQAPGAQPKEDEDGYFPMLRRNAGQAFPSQSQPKQTIPERGAKSSKHQPQFPARIQSNIKNRPYVDNRSAAREGFRIRRVGVKSNFNDESQNISANHSQNERQPQQPHLRRSTAQFRSSREPNSHEKNVPGLRASPYQKDISSFNYQSPANVSRGSKSVLSGAFRQREYVEVNTKFQTSEQRPRHPAHRFNDNNTAFSRRGRPEAVLNERSKGSAKDKETGSDTGDIQFGDSQAAFSSPSEYAEQMRLSRTKVDRKSRRTERFADPDDEVVTQVAPAKSQQRSQRFNYDAVEAEEMLYGEGKRKKKKGKQARLIEEAEPSRPILKLPEFISVERLARLLKVDVGDFVDKLEEEGFEGARYDHILDSGTSSMFADLYGFEPHIAGTDSVQDLVARAPAEDPSTLPPRPPIVTIMGHVDHGKTTILDYLRKSSVVASEHGGITQHIGAFSVIMPGSNRQITFLDTPGHEAFLEMRRRGANVTDIVVLVVAADDSVKPQTVEAIKHSLQANVQVIVAINKIDKPEADISKVKQDLARHDIIVEDFGGDYQVIPVSGKTGQGMSDLEEAIITLADVNDYRAEVDGPAEGWVIESKVTSAGRAATVLVRRGTLRSGDCIVAGTTWARVRTLRNDAGALVDEAPPGTPVQVDGWRGDDPSAGLEVLQADGEDHAKDVVGVRLEQEEILKTTANMTAINTARSAEAEARAKVLAWEKEQAWSKKSHNLRPKENAGWVESAVDTGPRKVHFVVKADVAGSVEALVSAVSAIGNNEIVANVIHSGTGLLTESDIRMLATTGEKCYAVSFNQPIDNNVNRLAEAAGLSVLDHNIIYKVTDSVKEILGDLLPPIITQRVLGEAEVGQIFEITMKRAKVKIAGCRVTNGTISRSHKVRVQRKGQIVFTGALSSLKNVKKDVAEMRKGTECGMGFEDWEDFEEGDQIQCFEEHQEKRTMY